MSSNCQQLMEFCKRIPFFQKVFPSCRRRSKTKLLLIFLSNVPNSLGKQKKHGLYFRAPCIWGQGFPSIESSSHCPMLFSSAFKKVLCIGKGPRDQKISRIKASPPKGNVIAALGGIVWVNQRNVVKGIHPPIAKVCQWAQSFVSTKAYSFM